MICGNAVLGASTDAAEGAAQPDKNALQKANTKPAQISRGIWTPDRTVETGAAILRFADLKTSVYDACNPDSPDPT
jgi:hypothetical protein